MKRLLQYPLILLLTIITVASCKTSAPTTTKRTAGNRPAVVDSTRIYRAALTTKQQRDYDKLYLEAICQKQKNNLDATYELLRHALEINPNASEALYEIAVLKLNKLNFGAFSSQADSLDIESATQELKRAYELEPSNPYFRSTLAQYYISNEDYEEATELYKIIAEEHPNEENLSILYHLQEELADHEAALKTLDHLEQQVGLTDDVAIGRYHIYSNMGKDEEAFNTIERLNNEHPNEPKYLSMLAEVYEEQGDSLKALALFEQVVKADPTNINALNGLLLNHLSAGRTDEFNKLFSEFMRSKKADAEEKFNLARVYAVAVAQQGFDLSPSDMLHHFMEALNSTEENEYLAELCYYFVDSLEDRISEEEKLDTYRAILEASPANNDARIKMLLHYISEEDPENIAKICQVGEQYNEDALFFYYYEGLALFQLNRTQESIDALVRGTAAINENTEAESASDLYAMLGDVYHETQMNEKAYEAYDEAIAFNPDNIMCLNNYAYFLSLEGKQLDKALEMSKHTVDAHPDDPTFLDTYAWILYKKGQYTMAKINIDQAVKNLPEEERETSSAANYYDHAGDIYYRCKDVNQAVEFWKQALQVADDQDTINKLNKKIKNRRL